MQNAQLKIFMLTLQGIQKKKQNAGIQPTRARRPNTLRTVRDGQLLHKIGLNDTEIDVRWSLRIHEKSPFPSIISYFYEIIPHPTAFQVIDIIAHHLTPAKPWIPQSFSPLLRKIPNSRWFFCKLRHLSQPRYGHRLFKEESMGLRIATNVSSLIAQRHAQTNSNLMDRSLEKLSSGYRINKSSDDAAGLAVSEGLRAKVRGLNQAKRNASDAVSMVQVAEGSLNEVGNIMIRLRELTVQSASDTIGDVERGYLNREYTQLVDEIDRISATSEFNSLKLFDPNQKDRLIIQVGVNQSEPEANIDTISIGLEGLKTFNSEALGLGKGAEIGPMEVDASDAVSREDITEKLNVIDNALTRLSGERATLGSIQSRLDTAMNSLGIQTENLTTANSRIRDVDFAEETSTLTQRKVLQASSMSVLMQANAKPEMALQLLR
jgi:flagellin